MINVNKENSHSKNLNTKDKAYVKNSASSQQTKKSGKRASLKDFQFGRALGKGKYGHVYLARPVGSKTAVAIKVLFKQVIEEHGMNEMLKREIEIQSRLRHRNILRLYCYFCDQDRIYMVMEYANKGSLFQILQKEVRFSESRAKRYIKQLIDALYKLQTFNIIHRDLKLENILLGAKDEIKLADFGCAVSSKDGFKKESDRRETFCGTLDYLAPEMVRGERYDERVDVWSLGVLCYEFLFGKSPFVDNCGPQMSTNETCQRIMSSRLEFPTHDRVGEAISVSEKAKHFISHLLNKNPQERFDLKQAKMHEWITEANDNLENDILL